MGQALSHIHVTDGDYTSDYNNVLVKYHELIIKQLFISAMKKMI
jgi:hypothetical protein